MNDLAVYEFLAGNSEAIYGLGTRYEAVLYLDWLNINRDINQYELAVSSITEDQADMLAFDLHEALLDLEILGCDDDE